MAFKISNIWVQIPKPENPNKKETVITLLHLKTALVISHNSPKKFSGVNWFENSSIYPPITEKIITIEQILITVFAAAEAEITKLSTALIGFSDVGANSDFNLNLWKNAMTTDEKICEKNNIQPMVMLLKTPLPTAKIIKAGPAFMQ